MERLLDGNRSFAAGQAAGQGRGLERRWETLDSQRPFAAVLACSDSRVSPELLFDQGIGDIFVVRTAGGVADDVALASLEFAVDHCHVPLVVVLGHSRCGAIHATLHREAVPARVGRLLDRLAPAVEQGRARGGDPWHSSVVVQVERTVAELRSLQPVMAPRVDSGELAVVGAYYELESGLVKLLDERY